VLPGSGGRPLPPTCPATPLERRGGFPGGRVRTKAQERELEVSRLLMMMKSGTGGLGDEMKEEAREVEERDAAVFETDGESKTENTVVIH